MPNRLASNFLPDAMTVALDAAVSDLPVALSQPVGATVNAYLCRGVVCLPPIEDIQVLLANLDTGWISEGFQSRPKPIKCFVGPNQLETKGARK